MVLDTLLLLALLLVLRIATSIKMKTSPPTTQTTGLLNQFGTLVLGTVAADWLEWLSVEFVCEVVPASWANTYTLDSKQRDNRKNFELILIIVFFINVDFVFLDML